MTRDCEKSRKRICKLSITSTPESLQSQKRSIHQNRLPLKGFGRFSRTTLKAQIGNTDRNDAGGITKCC